MRTQPAAAAASRPAPHSASRLPWRRKTYRGGGSGSAASRPSGSAAAAPAAMAPPRKPWRKLAQTMRSSGAPHGCQPSSSCRPCEAASRKANRPAPSARPTISTQSPRVKGSAPAWPASTEGVSVTRSGRTNPRRTSHGVPAVSSGGATASRPSDRLSQNCRNSRENPTQSPASASARSARPTAKTAAVAPGASSTNTTAERGSVSPRAPLPSRR